MIACLFFASPFFTSIGGLVPALPARGAPPASVALPGGPEVRWNASPCYVAGQPYKVQIEIEAPEGGTVVSSWLFTPEAFAVDGTALGRREGDAGLALPAGFKVSGEIDLGPHLKVSGDFALSYASGLAEGEPVKVQYLEQAPAGLNFVDMAVEELPRYQVLIETGRGAMLARMWPDVAPGHVRNFLDLAYTKFYDGTTFHRVIPTFMIQGGDPTGTGSGNGPRQLKAEFSSKQHLPGVLSMARMGGDPNSASCQFFICHGEAANLNGQYSAFGELVFGLDVVDKIAKVKCGPNNKPLEPQPIVRMLVLKAPAK